MDNREFTRLLEETGEVPCMNFPEMFFPSTGDDATINGSIKTAKELCQGCPIKWQCAEYAISNFEVHGIWGGTTPDDRKKMWRKAGIKNVEGA